MLLDFSNELSSALSTNKLSNLECFHRFIEQYADNVGLDAHVAADLLFCPDNYHNLAVSLNYYAIRSGIHSVVRDSNISSKTATATNNFLQQLFVGGELPTFLTEVLRIAIVPLLSDYVRFTKQKGLCNSDDLKNAKMIVLEFMTGYAKKKEKMYE